MVAEGIVQESGSDATATMTSRGIFTPRRPRSVIQSVKWRVRLFSLSGQLRLRRLGPLAPSLARSPYLLVCLVTLAVSVSQSQQAERAAQRSVAVGRSSNRSEGGQRDERGMPRHARGLVAVAACRTLVGGQQGRLVTVARRPVASLDVNAVSVSGAEVAILEMTPMRPSLTC